MRIKRCFRLICIIGIGALLLAACGRAEQVVQKTEENPFTGTVSMEETAVVEYAVPESLPNIMVDCQGYACAEEKEARVKGTLLPEEFYVIDAQSGGMVYTGKIADIQWNEESGLYHGYLDFTEVSEEGIYYLECDLLGRSEKFWIEEDMYRQTYRRIYTQAIEKCENHRIDVKELIWLLETYEWYGNLYPDEDGDGIPDLMHAIGAWILAEEEEATVEHQDAMYVVLLSKYGYLYQKLDRDYATECLKHATSLYGKLKTGETRDADLFFALTELFRATGQATYKSAIESYKSYFQNINNFPDQMEYQLAAMTYLATRQRVDVELCEIFMSAIMDQAEEIAGLYQEMIDPVISRNNGPEDVLQRAMKLSCANYITNNYQYTSIIQDFLHYLRGKNAQRINYFGQDTSMSYLHLYAQLISE